MTETTAVATAPWGGRSGRRACAPPSRSDRREITIGQAPNSPLWCSRPRGCWRSSDPVGVGTGLDVIGGWRWRSGRSTRSRGVNPFRRLLGTVVLGGLRRLDARPLARPGCATMRPWRGKATAIRSGSTRSPRRARTCTARPDSSASCHRPRCSTPGAAPGGSRSSWPGVGCPSSASTTTRRCSRPRAAGARSVTWIQADVTTLDLGQVFDVVVMAGNVPLFTPPGHAGRAGRRRGASRRPGRGARRRVPARPRLRARRVRPPLHGRRARARRRWATWAREPFPGDGVVRGLTPPPAPVVVAPARGQAAGCRPGPRRAPRPLRRPSSRVGAGRGAGCATAWSGGTSRRRARSPSRPASRGRARRRRDGRSPCR